MIYFISSVFILAEIFICLMGLNFSFDKNESFQGKRNNYANYGLKNINILKIITNTFNIFIAEYIVISGFLFMFDMFYVSNVLWMSFFADTVCLVILFLKKRINFKNVNFNVKDSILVVLIIAILVPFCWSKFETIYPDQDQGVYGLKAIELMYGDTNSQKELKEYNMLEEEDKEFTAQLQQNGQIGLYRLGSSDGYYYEYHAFPAFPAFMALFGMCFGVDKILYSLTPIFILLCLNIYFIVKKYAVTPKAELLAVLLVGFSPMAIYLAKISLTELIYSYLIVSGIFLFIQKDKISLALSVISFAALGFVHMVTLVYVPLIFFVSFILGLHDKKRDYFWFNIIFNILYIAALIYSRHVSSLYFKSQIKNMFGTIDADVCFYFIAAFCSFLCFVNLAAIVCFKNKIFRNGIELFDKYGVHILKILLILIIATVIVKGFLLGFTDYYKPGEAAWRYRANYLHKGFYSLLFLNFTSIIMETSYIAVPYIIYHILFKRKNKYTYEFIMFGYILIYSLAVYNILKTDVPIVYYAARYLFYLVVPATVIVFCIVVGKKFMVISAAVCIIANMHFNIATFNVHAENGGFEVLSDSLDVIEKGSVVIMDKDETHLGFLQTLLREVNQNLVFEKNSIENVIKKFPDKKIYILSGKDIEYGYAKTVFNKLYDNITGKYDSFNGIYPTTVGKQKWVVNISLYEREFKNPVCVFKSGFYEYETSSDDISFAWSKGVSAVNIEFGENRDCNKIIVKYGALPKYVTDSKSLNVKFKFDGEYIYETKIGKTGSQWNFMEFNIPEKFGKLDGTHELIIETDTWSPADYGKGDTRILGIPIVSVEVGE